jgi:hypothetical protein
VEPPAVSRSNQWIDILRQVLIRFINNAVFAGTESADQHYKSYSDDEFNLHEKIIKHKIYSNVTEKSDAQKHGFKSLSPGRGI